MSFLLDTDICSAHLKGNRKVWQKMMLHGGQLHVSAITVGELFTWAHRKKSSPARKEMVLHLLQDVTQIDVSRAIAERFGQLRAGLLDAGRSTPELDLLIASTALIHDFTLVTRNVQDYGGLPDLRIQNWFES